MIEVFDWQSRQMLTLPPEFVLVYQGGHHNVYCDGKRHYTTGGGYAGLSSPKNGRGFTGACDCQKYSNKGIV